MKKLIALALSAALLSGVMSGLTGCKRIKTIVGNFNVGSSKTDDSADNAENGEQTKESPAEDFDTLLKDSILPELGVCHSFSMDMTKLQEDYQTTIHLPYYSGVNPMYSHGVASALEDDLNGDGENELLTVEISENGSVHVRVYTLDGSRVLIYSSDILSNMRNHFFFYVFRNNGETFLTENHGGPYNNNTFETSYTIYRLTGDGDVETVLSGSADVGTDAEFFLNGETVEEEACIAALENAGVRGGSFLTGFPESGNADATPVFSGGCYYEGNDQSFHIQDHTDALSRPEFTYQEDDSINDEVLALLDRSKEFYETWCFAPRTYVDETDTFTADDGDYPHTYVRVDHPTVHSVEDLINEAKTCVTEEIARASFLENSDYSNYRRIPFAPSYTDRDGKLYVFYGEWGDATSSVDLKTYRVTDDLYYLFGELRSLEDGQPSGTTLAARLIRTDSGLVFGDPDFLYLYDYVTLNGRQIDKSR